tara:strand:+ start:23131 stop:23343 length:213 start_codon:yes stop_codon:yes gene_type:complete
MEKPYDDYYVAWRSYNPKTGGCCTHITRYGSNKALCGVITLEGSGQSLKEADGFVGCKRCQKAIKRAMEQ